MDIISASILILFGLSLLIGSANFFIDATANIALQFRIPPLITGLVIVGFATSAPEIIVGIEAAWQNKIDLAIGNAIGSNIANIGLILGITALFLSPIIIKSMAIKKIYMLMFLIMFIPLALMKHESNLSHYDGFILLLCLVISFFILKKIATTIDSNDPVNSQFSEELLEADNKNKMKAFTILIINLVLLLVGAHFLVLGAVAIAERLEISDLIIGLTIVAVGTSLPEIAASAASIMKKKADIAIGNVIGSNMFNMLAVLGIPAIIQDLPVGKLDSDLFIRDIAAMFILTVVLAIMLFGPKRVKLTRTKGALLLILFGLYQYFIYLDIAG